MRKLYEWKDNKWLRIYKPNEKKQCDFCGIVSSHLTVYLNKKHYCHKCFLKTKIYNKGE